MGSSIAWVLGFLFPDYLSVSYDYDLGYWSTKGSKCLLSDKGSKANINLVELKFAKVKR